jgi:hypothetical protein
MKALGLISNKKPTSKLNSNTTSQRDLSPTKPLESTKEIDLNADINDIDQPCLILESDSVCTSFSSQEILDTPMLSEEEEITIN